MACKDARDQFAKLYALEKTLDHLNYTKVFDRRFRERVRARFGVINIEKRLTEGLDIYDKEHGIAKVHK